MERSFGARKWGINVYFMLILAQFVLSIREMADAIITLAMYHITTGNTFNRVAHWQRIFRTPCQRPLPGWDGGGRGKQDMKDDDRTLVSYELNAKKVEEAKHITPFVGRQLEFCEAFGFPVPDNCAPKYKARKVKAKRPGRPPKPKVIAEEG